MGRPIASIPARAHLEFDFEMNESFETHNEIPDVNQYVVGANRLILIIIPNLKSAIKLICITSLVKAMK